MISSYLTGAFSSAIVLEKEEFWERLEAIGIAFCSASSGSLDTFSSFSSAGRARLIFELETLELGRGVTTPAVYARDNFGILGLLALLIVFENPFFNAAAATLAGVFGISSSSRFLWYGCAFNGSEVEEKLAKGSEFRKEWEADWKLFLVFVTREVRFDARREALRGGKVEGRVRLVVEAA
jgi:hypothetical protein